MVSRKKRRFNLMKHFKSVLALMICIALISAIDSPAQKVPISFNDYHGYTSTVKYMKQIAQAHPNITKLLEIGKSNMGRPLYVLVISNMKTGTTIDSYVKLRNMRREGVKNVTPMQNYQGKPGHWICASTHGNEFTGTEVCLYTIDKLVSEYNSDSEITRLIDTKTFYICPVVNPDGLYNSIEGGIPQRYNSMKRDDDGDGKINEDGGDDLNKDGHITRFRYKDPKGRYVIDEADPRLMVRLSKDEKTKKQRYTVVREDKDNDGDGKRGEDSERGIDLNRNFPEGWFKDDGMAGGSGDYPTSSPEARAIAEFFTNHRNILMAQFYHTSGGFTFRPMGTAPHPKLHPKDVAVFDLIMGKKYLEIIGEEVPEAWEKPELLDKFKEELKKSSKNKYAAMRGYELPRGWKVSYDEIRDRRYSYGMATDWAYMQYGIYSITTELWNPSRDIKDFAQFKGKDARLKQMRALLKYQDEKYGGKLFLPWKKYKHPELGEGEIGGWIPKYYGNNALPGEPLLNVCEKHWQFELFRAGLMPEIEISDVKTQVLYTTNKAGKSKGKYKIIEITAKLENKGNLATHLARGAQLAGNREDVVWLIGDRDKLTFLQGTPFQKLGVLEGAQNIPGYVEKSKPISQESQSRQRWSRYFRPQYYPRESSPQQQRPEPQTLKQTGPKRTVRWLIAMEGSTPLKIVVSSQKGGTKVKNVTIQ